jgi:hypothetical protein
MLRHPNRWIGHGTMSLAKLSQGHARDFRPVLLCGVHIESPVEIHGDAQPCLINGEERSQPPTEERDHHRVAIRELHAPVALRAFAGEERDAGGEERFVGEHAHPLHPELVHRVYLGELGEVQGTRIPERRALPGLGFEDHISHPERHGGLRDSELVSDLLQRPRLRAQVAGAVLVGDLAAVSHGRSLPNIHSVRSVGIHPR